MPILDGRLVRLHMINMIVKYELDSYIVIKLIKQSYDKVDKSGSLWENYDCTSRIFDTCFWTTQ